MSTLIEGLKAHPDWPNAWTANTEGECTTITTDDDLTAVLHLGQQQITVETFLFPAQSVANPQALNDLILRTHQLVPLSTVAITTIDNSDYYVAFGALSKDSKLEVIIQEIDTLFSNVNDFLEMYQAHITEVELSQ